MDDIEFTYAKYNMCCPTSQECQKEKRQLDINVNATIAGAKIDPSLGMKDVILDIKAPGSFLDNIRFPFYLDCGIKFSVNHIVESSCSDSELCFPARLEASLKLEADTPLRLILGVVKTHINLDATFVNADANTCFNPNDEKFYLKDKIKLCAPSIKVEGEILLGSFSIWKPYKGKLKGKCIDFEL